MITYNNSYLYIAESILRMKHHLEGWTSLHPAKKLVFLCGARDYHAMDWYRSARLLFPRRDIMILTDLIGGEGFKKLIDHNDAVFYLFVLDSFLFKTQSKLGNYWRNLLKLVVFPIQVLLLIRFSRRYPDCIYHAHSMYYLWLACAARVKFIGTPQGSDILIKPYRSTLYRIASGISLRRAKAVTVDSIKMASSVREIAGVTAVVIQNGIDISAVTKVKEAMDESSKQRNVVLSIRAMTPLYRIENIVASRNHSQHCVNLSILFIHPFYDSEYLARVCELMRESDKDLGRVNRDEMYSLLLQAKLVISIPSSDSSPRSVYEAIFCGAAVALTYHPYIDALPACMKARVILIDLESRSWFDDALEAAELITQNPFTPSNEALDTFDQVRSFRILDSLLA